jgi:hypothetical protein
VEVTVRRYFFVYIGIVTFLVSFARDAAACSCMEGPGPCGALTQSDSVFVGRVVDIRTTARATIFDGLTVRFEIERTFKGLSVTQKTVEVLTGNSGGDCGYDFKLGQKYFVFAHRSSGSLYTSICSNTRLASEAEDDLELIDAFVRGRAETRIFGRIELVDERIEASPTDMSSLNLAGMRVEARDNRTVLSGTTDIDGRYRIKNVPPGRYAIRLVGMFPPNLEVIRASAQETQIDLPARCGARVDFPAYSLGTIRGRVLDSSGRPANGNIMA